MRLFTNEELEKDTLRKNTENRGDWSKFIHIYGPKKDVDFSTYDEQFLNIVKTISIRNHMMTELDLTPLESCDKIEKLTIERTNIKNIDLSFLEGKQIKLLNIRYNRFEDIDLSSLKSCHQLNSLSVGTNNLTEIDLEPLKNLKNLKKVNLAANRISEIDLELLRNLPLLDLLFHSFKVFKEIDFSPLFEQKDLQWLVYSLPSGKGEELKGFREHGRVIRYRKKERFFKTVEGKFNVRCPKFFKITGKLHGECIKTDEKEIIRETWGEENRETMTLLAENTIFKK